MNGRVFDIYARGGLSEEEINDSFNWLNDSFKLYTELLGPYNQDHFTLEYGYFYGIESTGILYCSENIDEGTVVHEVIHQWFYSMVGNDQFDFSFLDESLTTFSSALDYRNSLKPSKSEVYESSLQRSFISSVTEMDVKYGLMIYYHG